MKVIVVEDVLLVREGLVRMLRERNIDVLATRPDAVELLTLVRSHRPDAVILDIRLPPTFTDEGLRAARDMQDQFPDVGVLVLSQHLDSAYAVQLLRNAPERVGYLLKDRIADIAIIVDALRRIHDGETVVDPTIVTRVIGRRRRDNPLVELTERELEVLQLVAEGLSNRGIAECLTVAERTVESHIASTFVKLGLTESADQNRRVRLVLTWLREH
jgi:DNA-binding NarL/FixJ family response regulator